MFVALFIVLMLGVIFRHVLKKAPLAIRQIPLHVLGATILILEVIKQAYHLIIGDWHVWFLPLHFCSFFLVWYGLALFTRGKTRQLMYFCSITGGIMVSILLFIAPRMILHDAAHDIWSCFDHFHTFFYHMGVVAYWVWMIMLDIYHPERIHIRKAIMIYSIFYFVVIAGAYIFHENFTDVLRSSFTPFDNFRIAVGQFAYDIALLAIGIGSIALVSTLTYYNMNKLYQRNLQKNAYSIEQK